MDKKSLNKIFLSASIPTQYRDKVFYDTTDIIAIRDSVRALATVIIPKIQLIWGGHPSITPLIAHVMNRMDRNFNEHVSVYQSHFFDNNIPNIDIIPERITYTPSLTTQEESLNVMRVSMLKNNDFKAGIFIGGMDGILIEYELFCKYNPKAIVLPVATTGGAAKMIFQKKSHLYDPKLATDYAYMALFERLLSQIINN